MILIYRRPGSEGATELAEAVDGRRVRFYEGGGVFRRLREGARRYPVTPEDLVVCWGERIQGDLPEGVRTLNNAPLLDKFTDAEKLKEAGVPTVEVVKVKPPETPQVDPALTLWEELQEAANIFIDTPLARNPPYRDGVIELVRKANMLHNALGTPIPVNPQFTWLGRTLRHHGGEDLLNPPEAPEYFSRKEDLSEEFRIHSFLGKSIKAGVKVPREGQAPHAWIRSLQGGWRINYNGFESRKEMRDLAHAAVKALSLDFGAVDLGKRRGGGLIVLEVNRAPGLGDGTSNSYASAIRRFRDGAQVQEEGR